MMGVDPSRVDHAVGGVDDLLARARRQLADGLDGAACHAQVRPGVALALTRSVTGTLQAGQDGGGIANQDGIGRHASSLSCQCDSAMRDTTTITPNNATPVSVIRNSAANRRGILSAKPACRIW